MWSEYHEYLHSYKIEKEYVKYCEELSVKLKVTILFYVFSVLHFFGLTNLFALSTVDGRLCRLLSVYEGKYGNAKILQ